MPEIDFSQYADWRSQMERPILKKRNDIIRKIRDFFYERGVLEVETPIISQHGVTDLHLDSFKTQYEFTGKHYYLNTSPEYHMKRLLAGGSGPIFQICKCFRQDPHSKKHNPEFTMLEWYRTGYPLQRLLDEVEDLFKLFFEVEKLDRFSYDFIFQKYLGFSALEASMETLIKAATQHGLYHAESCDRDTLLEYLFSHQIEPYLGSTNPVAITDYPASQAALAKLSPEDYRTAQRAEVFYKGMELANGFHELTDADQQYHRFQLDLKAREQHGKELLDPDLRFIAALKHGMPESSGIALGLDRFIMLVLECEQISDVMTFTIENT